MLGIRGLIAVAVIGVAGTFFASEALRDEARQGWELEVTNTAATLTGALLNWLEESYAPISGLAALAESSGSVSEAEFLNAYDGLEARATAFFLEAAALVTPDETDSDGTWRIWYSTDLEGVLSPDAPASEKQQILEAVEVAKARFGEIILSRPITYESGGSAVSLVALGTFTAEGQLAIVGLVDYPALIKGLYDLLVPEGVTVRVSGRFPERDGPGPERAIIERAGAGRPLSPCRRARSAPVPSCSSSGISMTGFPVVSPRSWPT